jgi:hypothetical protein
MLKRLLGERSSLGSSLLCSELPGLTRALLSANGAGSGVIPLLRAGGLRSSVPFVRDPIARSTIVPLPVAAKEVRQIIPLLLALLPRVPCAPTLLGVSTAISPMLPTIVGVLSGAIDSTEIGSRQDTKRCMSRNVHGLPLLTVPQAAVVECK